MATNGPRDHESSEAKATVQVMTVYTDISAPCGGAARPSNAVSTAMPIMVLCIVQLRRVQHFAMDIARSGMVYIVCHCGSITEEWQCGYSNAGARY